MLCAISGEAPQVPVVSKKSGAVFEKRLIEAYIAENGTDPTTNEELTTEDLVELKASNTVRPRPPTFTSIPSMLSAFQNEWDALALELFNTRQTLEQTRQELSTALYQNDAAVRVIARLQRERDEARDALARIQVNGGAASGGDDMQVDGQGLSEALAAQVDAVHEKLAKTRRKRPVPEDWATTEDIEAFKSKKLSDLPGTRAIAIDKTGESILFGGETGNAGIFSLGKKKVVQSLKSSGTVTDVQWIDNRAAIATSTGTVQIFDQGAEVSSFSRHAGEATAIAVHPTGNIIASVGVDKSLVFYDLESAVVAAQTFTNATLTCAAFHPDGNLFAAGGTDCQIKVFEVKTGKGAAIFDALGPIQSIAFSENGTWLAAVSKGQTSIQIWDLRKGNQIKSLEIGSPVTSVSWDYTGQFLVAAGPSGVVVQQYSKSTKEWSEPLRSGAASITAQWGAKAQSLISLGVDGSITELA